MQVAVQDVVLLAFGVMMFMEGMLYAILPRDILRRMFLYVLDLPPARFRFAALLIAATGIVLMRYALGS
ncbi:MAG: DUF2065 family protein [Proteobacteria bacterium]|jgi:uncharacterized protein YjeT (DUF2065 family)|nr:DUF2065 family protein [Pseudomonadota bacterium]|tara:strand:+ start:472 stop:678 length:207 start_codon:yes stop_codon:yes gene_type:complete